MVLGLHEYRPVQLETVKKLEKYFSIFEPSFFEHLDSQTIMILDRVMLSAFYYIYDKSW